MLYTIETFVTDEDGHRRMWAKPFAIADSEIGSYRETALALINSLLDEGQPDSHHPISLNIHDTTGEIVFAYLRPAFRQD